MQYLSTYGKFYILKNCVVLIKDEAAYVRIKGHFEVRYKSRLDLDTYLNFYGMLVGTNFSIMPTLKKRDDGIWR